MLLLESFSAPQSDQFAGAKFWACSRSSAVKHICWLGSSNLLPLTQCREKQSLFNLQSRKQEWTKISNALRLSSFPLCPQELCFAVYHHFQSSHTLEQWWFEQPGPPGAVLSQVWWQRMLTQPIAAASPPRGPQHWKGWLGDSTSCSVLQIWMHRINSCGVWVTEQRYPCGGSYSTYPAVNTNQLAELEGQAGSSSALAPLSAHLWKGIPQVLPWQHMEEYQQ